MRVEHTYVLSCSAHLFRPFQVAVMYCMELRVSIACTCMYGAWQTRDGTTNALYSHVDASDSFVASL